MKNKMAEIHKSAEEKRAFVVAKKGEDKYTENDTLILGCHLSFPGFR